MCGRYGRRADKQRIAEWMQTHNTNVFDDSYLAPSYNVAPQTFQPVVCLDSETGERELTVMRWGLVPYWSKDGKAGFSTISAKAETLLEKPMWKGPFTKRRCLVPATGYYEWQQLSAKTKQPWLYALKTGGLFAFAGLWDRWKAPDGMALDTYSIITTEANELAASVHYRMPVIVKPADYGRWLEPGDPQRLPIDLLRPYDSEQMTAWRVSADVGNVRNNSPDLCQPINFP